MNTLRARIKPYIQPFERTLALRELQALSNDIPRRIGRPEDPTSEFEVFSAISAACLASRLAYWESVDHSSGSTITTQILRESTINLVRNGIAIDSLRQQLPFGDDVPLPNRRCLRYGTHGVHEYRGKFFPQLVRSLINISGLQPGATVGDPMSGSGTTVVESILANCTGRGLDMNPLSVFMGNVKAKLLSADPERIARDYEKVRSELMATESRRGRCLAYFESLPDADRSYLSAWFSPEVLSGLDDISLAILRVEDENSRDLMRVSLSNIIRNVSWQKNDDLRVRKDVRLDVDIDPKKEFLEELGRSVRAVLAFLFQNLPVPNPKFEIVAGDARSCGSSWGENSIDVVITSPPYATALPYLDTDRLSLCYLGLLPRPEHRIRDKSMIGNREVSEKIRKDYWGKHIREKSKLPQSVSELIDKIDTLNSGTSVGFRRRNLPALLSKYFFDMKEVIEGIKIALKPGHCAFVVVGNNHTVAGGQRVDIQTAKFLSDIAASIGFEIADPLPMEMLVSRDIFKGNAMASEEILVFKKPLHQ
jgi:DNA modification methylase